MKLIDADSLLKSCRLVPVHDGETWAYTNIVTEGDIMSAPAINPEDLRAKGRWIDGTCSVCKFDAPYIENSTVQILTDFCPNCGAEMEG